jgi:mannose/fructose/N-acetylgalactosamine-specific phosphotransferase system component IID
MKKFALLLSYLVIALFLVSIATFVTFGHVVGYFLALVAAIIAFALWKQWRWGYFAAAAFGLACFQLAKQGYQFQTLKREAMILGVLMIPIAIFLHEQLTKPKPDSNNVDPS